MISLIDSLDATLIDLGYPLKETAANARENSKVSIHHVFILT